MLVSIGIPTYNRADGYLRNALESALAQTYDNIEVIVSDNCSTDDTEDLIKSYTDKRIRYFRQENNLGVEGNFNYCVEQARGEYFLLLCDDDLIDPDFVETCVRAIDGLQKPGLIRTGTRVINGDGNVVKSTPNRSRGKSISDFIFSWFASETALYMCSTLFHTESLKAAGGFRSKTNLYLDVAVESKVAAEYGYLDIEEVKASFRRHDANNGTASKVEDWVTDSHYLIDSFCKLVPAEEERIRNEGLVYFTKANYRRARRIPTLPARWKSYYSVYKRFNYAYSPVKFFVRPVINSRIRAVKRRLSLM